MRTRTIQIRLRTIHRAVAIVDPVSAPAALPVPDSDANGGCAISKDTPS